MNVLERNKVKILELQTSCKIRGTHIWLKGRESDSEKDRDIGGDRANKREREVKGRGIEIEWKAYSILSKISQTAK